MSFYLSARNKELEKLRVGAFSWHWMMEAGVGWPVGYDKGVNPESPLYKVRKDEEGSTSESVRVTADEARQMARLALMVAEHQDMVAIKWEQLAPDEQERVKNDKAQRCNVPVRRDFVEKARAFATWAEASKGFCVD